MFDFKPYFFIFSSAIVLAGQAHSDTVLNDDHIVTGRICIGSSCVDGEVFGNNALKVTGTTPHIYLQDTSLDDGGTFPWADWVIRPNDPGSGGMNRFSIESVNNSNALPFSIDQMANTNSLWIGTYNNIGMGTAFPQANLHIANGFSPTIRLDHTATPRGTWDIGGNNGNLFIRDWESETTPFAIQKGARTYSLAVSSQGFVGMGTYAPEGKLHTKGDGVQLAYFESGDGDAVQVRFRTDSENRRFLAVNNADEVKTQMQFRDDEILFLGQTVAQEWLSVSAAGITTAGPSCSSPCDAVFDPDAFTVPPIEERAALMWDQKHLPAIGPTAPDQPINLTEKMGGVIHELEVAHIYIEDLHRRLEAQGAEIAGLRADLARFDMQDVQIKALTSQLQSLGNAMH